VVKRFEVPDWAETPPEEPCAKEFCGHPLSVHDYLCRGNDPTHPQGICSCEQFDDRAYVARRAQLHVLTELLALDRYDHHTLDDVLSWARHEIGQLGGVHHTPGEPYQLRYPGGKDGMWQVDCSCGEYRTAPYRTSDSAAKVAQLHATDKNKESKR
jgi:hypothetical protein